MIRKICAIALCIVMSCALCVYAEEIVQDNPIVNEQAEAQQDMPPRGGRGFRGGPGGGMPFGERGEMPQPPEGMIPPDMADGGNIEPPAFDSGQTPPRNGVLPEVSDTDDTAENGTAEDGTAQNPDRAMGGMRGGMGANSPEAVESTAPLAETADEPQNVVEEYFTPIVSMILLAAAFVFVIFYKRRMY